MFCRVLIILGHFFMNPDPNFPDSDFVRILIWTQEKKVILKDLLHPLYICMYYLPTVFWLWMPAVLINFYKLLVMLDQALIRIILCCWSQQDPIIAGTPSKSFGLMWRKSDCQRLPRHTFNSWDSYRRVLRSLQLTVHRVSIKKTLVQQISCHPTGWMSMGWMCIGKYSTYYSTYLNVL